jgi:predicted acetyltransferase
MNLVIPAREHLPSYIHALTRGWSADNIRGAVAAAEELAEIETNAEQFLAHKTDPDAKAPPITLPDGTVIKRLPGLTRWMWDGDFCGSINLRWQHGTTELPPTCLGHVGYAVVPWKQNRGYARAALRDILIDAANVGLPWIELTTDIDNLASRRVMEVAGGHVIEHFMKPAIYGGKASVRYRIATPLSLHKDTKP